MSLQHLDRCGYGLTDVFIVPTSPCDKIWITTQGSNSFRSKQVELKHRKLTLFACDDEEVLKRFMALVGVCAFDHIQQLEVLRIHQPWNPSCLQNIQEGKKNALSMWPFSRVRRKTHQILIIRPLRRHVRDGYFLHMAYETIRGLLQKMNPGQTASFVDLPKATCLHYIGQAEPVAYL